MESSSDVGMKGAPFAITYWGVRTKTPPRRHGSMYWSSQSIAGASAHIERKGNRPALCCTSMVQAPTLAPTAMKPFFA